MKKELIKALEEMLDSPDVKGKKHLQKVLWLNTSAPKYKPGDCFVITERGHYVYGHAIKDFHAKVVDVKANSLSMQYSYELDMVCKAGSAETIAKTFMLEDVLSNFAKCEDNVNIIGEPKSKYSQSMSI